MYVLNKDGLKMTYDPPYRRTLGPRNDHDLVLNVKRKLPDTCQKHVQERSEKMPKIEDSGHPETENGKPPPRDPSPCVKKVTTCEVDHTKQKYPSTWMSKPECKAHTQLPLKVKYESSVRRFAVPDFTSFKDLKMILAKRMLEDKVMAIEYKDDQGDRVVLSSEKDMAELSRVSRESDMKPVQLCVSLWPR